MVAGPAAVLAGASDSAVSRPVPIHLLLLPRRVLQGVLGRPGLVRGWRAARAALSRRALVSARPPERASLLRLCRGDLPDPAGVERRPSELLYLWLPLAAARARRARRRSVDQRRA